MFTKIDFEQVKARISPFVHETSIVSSQSLNELTGNSLFIKPECLQKTGSFKIRGAASKVTSLQGQNIKGLVTASSGNHGQAVAYMAKALSIKSIIVIPNNAPEAKIKAIKAYGAEIVMVGPKSNERLEMAKDISQEMEYIYIPPYDDYEVIKGQGTIGLELINWGHSIDKVFVPIGGGGLLSGIASCIKAINPKIKVIGVEPQGSCCMYTSIKAGERKEISPDTIADGLRTVIPGEITFPIVQKKVDDIILVEEGEIKEAMKLVLERMKLVIEPSGAVSVAAMLKEKGEGKNLVAVVSGGNLDIMKIAEIIAK
ncbi:MAG: threo-3-hydroxy-L-aspartate ammonia-lyase [Clostridia bacterium]|jgi:threonine dehydratase|nr:threo-3-hydroxy-L-aspartate ammonia-lyase [Clostridia bacterium]MDN5324150.1 threo-3-hydroxy-L-aspartate ammonia-lyase [Clostridia bacterium]